MRVPPAAHLLLRLQLAEAQLVGCIQYETPACNPLAYATQAF